jgi:hypothetical protein
MTHLDTVTGAGCDRFEAHPCRRYRPRPTPIAELMPGEVIVPGSHIFAAVRSGPLVPRQGSARLPLLGAGPFWPRNICRRRQRLISLASAIFQVLHTQGIAHAKQ